MATSLNIKVDGAWKQATRPYVKVAGVWRPCSDAYIKKAGVWQRSFHYDPTPPNPPEVDLRILEEWDTSGKTPQLVTRYINVGVQIPGSMNDPNCQLIRVCTGAGGKPPVGHEGPNYIPEPDQTFTDESWSNFWYNQPKGSPHSGHPDTSQNVVKQWPRNAGPGTTIKGDTTYFFGAWSQNFNGVWSMATQASIHVPKDTVDTPRYLHKEATFQANNSGSWRNAGWQPGRLIQLESPRSTGLWFYGEQLSDAIGASSRDITILDASIWVERCDVDDDPYAQSANVYLYWHNNPTVASLPAAGQAIGKNDITKLGTLAKGQGKWFDIPQSFYSHMNSDIKGMGLDFKAPNMASAQPDDMSVIKSISDNLRCGQVHVLWNEAL